MKSKLKGIEMRYELEEEALLREKRLVMESEDEVFRQKKQSLSYLDELADKANYYLREFFEDPSDLHQTFQMIEATKDEVLSACQQEQFELDRRIEVIDQECQKNRFRYERELLDIGNEASC
ncbi:hypothetical protein I6N95_13300 [Vagococcus sp. BWB3-3]|uniref:Uncharacterized protein n=1 Tax=Vagococcus allomyrinae TaxID=2794353 RepID=A0A940PEF0_9ENTE|nr:hypothetical protein [Vagococcus allomyrinae]MBP1041991.1 hypothetical protein [Vagococcus allomyrinae]